MDIREERRAIIRKLRRLDKKAEWPAIYSDRLLKREIERERLQLRAQLRQLPLTDLPLAG